MKDCHFCQNKIKGDGHTRHISICHPTKLYNKVKICSNCHYFAKNNTESKETLIK